MCYWKTKNKIICRHFLIDDTCKKGTGSQNTYCHLWKKMGQIVNLIVALLSILVPCDWKWLCFFTFYPWTWQLLSLCSSYNEDQRESPWRSSDNCCTSQRSAWHTSKSVLGIDWGITG